MPGVGSIQASYVTAAISRAAARTGVDFDYLMAQARIESGLNPAAQARTSSARGLYQFVNSTWLRTLDKHGAKHGLGWAGQAITGDRIHDPLLRTQIMALRDNADASALMAAELALDNRDGLRASLGREPDNSELYLAHFLGIGGAQTFLSALASDPDASAEQVNPAAARANRGIFFEAGRARTVGQVMAVIRDKMAGASGLPDAGSPHFAATVNHPRPDARWQMAGAGERSPVDKPQHPVSMAETLRSTFGDGSGLGDRGGARVAAAYGKFRAFSL